MNTTLLQYLRDEKYTFFFFFLVHVAVAQIVQVFHLFCLVPSLIPCHRVVILIVYLVNCLKYEI
jgi:hypothetical protein